MQTETKSPNQALADQGTKSNSIETNISKATTVKQSYSIWNILNRLDRVKQVGQDRWVACCPAHEDTNPSLRITDNGDKALIKCWAGCSFDEIRTALGMDAHEFFAGSHAPASIAPGISKSAVNEELILELLVCLCACNDRKNKLPINPIDAKREKEARERIIKAWRYL